MLKLESLFGWLILHIQLILYFIYKYIQFSQDLVHKWFTVKTMSLVWPWHVSFSPVYLQLLLPSIYLLLTGLCENQAPWRHLICANTVDFKCKTLVKLQYVSYANYMGPIFGHLSGSVNNHSWLTKVGSLLKQKYTARLLKYAQIFKH